MRSKTAFVIDVTDADALYNCSVPAQLLYFRLCQSADGDGINTAPDGLRRKLEFSKKKMADYLNELESAGYIIRIDDCVAIVHFAICNRLDAKNGYTPTTRLDVRDQLGVTPNRLLTNDPVKARLVPIGGIADGVIYNRAAMERQALHRSKAQVDEPDEYPGDLPDLPPANMYDEDAPDLLDVIGQCFDLCDWLRPEELTEDIQQMFSDAMNDLSAGKLIELFRHAGASDWLAGKTDNKDWPSELEWIIENSDAVLAGKYDTHGKKEIA